MASISYIQKRVKDQGITRGCKVEVLVNYWNKLYGKIQWKATCLKDKEITELCKYIAMVPKHI